MHHSRLSNVIIDCQDLEAGVRFWSQAFGTAPLKKHGPYVFLRDTQGGVYIGLQEVPESRTSKSRVHIDIMTDDVEAEVQRLEELGARRREQVENWWIMEDPCGNEFCVVPVERKDFMDDVLVWDDLH